MEALQALVAGPPMRRAQQADGLDGSLWAAFRALDERANLAGRLAREAARLSDPVGGQRFAG